MDLATSLGVLGAYFTFLVFDFLEYQMVATAIEALRDALAQQGEQQPVAWKHTCNALCVDGLELWVDACPHCGKPRSAGAAPVAQPLTDEQIKAIVRDAAQGAAFRRDGTTSIRIARAIEAAHGIGVQK